MALKMRPTGLGHGVYKDVPDYGVFCGEWCIGRIYRDAHRPRGSALGSGRCTHLASQGRCGPRTKLRRWKWPRPSLRQVGNNGRRGRSSKRSPDAELRRAARNVFDFPNTERNPT